MPPPCIQVLITTGDTNGVGLEISLKALRHLKPKKNVQLLLITSKKIRFQNISANLQLPK